MNFDDPTVLKVVGSIGMLLMTGVGYLIKSLVDNKKEATTKNANDIDEIKKYIDAFKDQVIGSYGKLKHSLHEAELTRVKEHAELKTQLEVTCSQISQYSERVSEMKGRVDDHADMVSKFISTLSHMSKQIDALFRYVDANGRATDFSKGEKTGTDN